MLFGLVANRALAPSSKLAAAEWMSRDVHIDGLGEVSDDACYRAMDWLHDVRGELEKQVYFQVADLLNLQVDLLFFDTTSTYFEAGEADEEVPRDWRGEKTAGQDGDGSRPGGDAGTRENPAGKPAGFREYGKSKDSRDDLPQIVIGLAVTREGIPVRAWCWPGSTADSALIRQVKKDMRDWSLGRVIWVADRGFTSKANRKFLQQGGGAYIIGEKLRSGSTEVQAALSRQGRYKTVAGNLQVKEVRLPEAGDRFIVCYNPDQAVRDAAVRAKMITRWKSSSTAPTSSPRRSGPSCAGRSPRCRGRTGSCASPPAACSGPTWAGRRPRRTSTASTCCAAPTRPMSAEDIAAGYKQLLEVERGWRDMKSVLDLHPVYHRLEERIRAHVLLCWLALLLIRVAENQHRPDLARHAPRAAAHRHRHLHRPRRHLPPAHRHPQDRPRPAHGPGHRHPPQDPRAHHGRQLIKAPRDEPPPRDTARS